MILQRTGDCPVVLFPISGPERTLTADNDVDSTAHAADDAVSAPDIVKPTAPVQFTPAPPAPPFTGPVMFMVAPPPELTPACVDAADPPNTVPVIVTVDDSDPRPIPGAFVPDPPVTFPTTVIVDVKFSELMPLAFSDPPDTFPVTVMTAPLAFTLIPVPWFELPVTAPTTFRVPVPAWKTPVPDEDGAIAPLIVVDVGDDAEYVKHVAAPATMPLPVSVIVRAVETSNPPPAVMAGEAFEVLRKEPTLISWFIVTVKLFEYTSSPTPGRDAPPSHVPTADQFPVATAYLVAIRHTLQIQCRVFLRWQHSLVAHP